jgi:hypothetical protein
MQYHLTEVMQHKGFSILASGSSLNYKTPSSPVKASIDWRLKPLALSIRPNLLDCLLFE